MKHRLFSRYSFSVALILVSRAESEAYDAGNYLLEAIDRSAA